MESTTIKVDPQADWLISHAAHLPARSEADVADVAAREYIDSHREVIHEATTRALRELDGSVAGCVALLIGMSRAELDEIGGVPELQPGRRESVERA